jgi:histidyl-tRNA synthetase
MEAIGLGGEENAGRRLTVLRAVDKLDRLGMDGIRELLGAGRRDESGDFTTGAGLASEQIDRLVFYLSASYRSGSVDLSAEARRRGETSPIWNPPGEETFPDDSFSFLSWRNAVENSTIGLEGVNELEAMAELCRSADYGPGRINFESSVVRGLEYYTGPVFEADLTFEVKDDDGRPVRFGSVGGGGRYDGLVGRFMKQDVPATGFSVGVSRLQAALAALGKGGAREADGPVVVLVMDRGRFGDYQAMVSRLRGAGVAAELYLGDSGMKAQMKYADRRNAPLAIIQGEDEKKRAVVQIKDLVEGKRLAEAIADHAAYREERPGQFEVAEAELVDAVKQALARDEPRRP